LEPRAGPAKPLPEINGEQIAGCLDQFPNNRTTTLTTAPARPGMCLPNQFLTYSIVERSGFLSVMACSSLSTNRAPDA